MFAAVVNGRKMVARYLLKYGARIDRKAEVLFNLLGSHVSFKRLFEYTRTDNHDRLVRPTTGCINGSVSVIIASGP